MEICQSRFRELNLLCVETISIVSYNVFKYDVQNRKKKKLICLFIDKNKEKERSTVILSMINFQGTKTPG